MPHTTPTIGRVLTIAGFSLSCFGLLLFLWLAFGGPAPLKPKGYQVQVGFSDATTLAEQADVRVAGVSVGKVVGKELAPEGGRTLATIELKSEYAPLRADSRAVLRQKTLLGETYIELTTGTRGSPALQDGDRLAQQRVSEAVEFDELLRTFDSDTRKAFQQWQAASAKATGGLSRELNDALGNFPVFAEEAGSVVDVLERRQDSLRGLVRGTGDTFEAITRNEASFQQLITRSNDVFQTLSGRREALAETISILPTFQREARATMDRLGGFSQRAEPLLADLEPVLGDTQSTLSALRELAPDLNALFGDLRPLITAGRQGFPALGNVLRGLDPTLARFGPFLQQLNPILEYLELNQPTVSDFIGTGGSALNLKVAKQPDSKSLGHALPQLIVLGSQSLPAAERDAANRGNSYFAPGALGRADIKDPTRFTLPSWDCAHIGGDKPPTDTPGCLTQEPTRFQGESRKYPGPRPAAPGGARRAGDER